MEKIKIIVGVIGVTVYLFLAECLPRNLFGLQEVAKADLGLFVCIFIAQILVAIVMAGIGIWWVARQSENSSKSKIVLVGVYLLPLLMEVCSWIRVFFNVFEHAPR